jgi:hypothetical protein
MTALVAQHDLLAIPHEVGHFLFWNGLAPAVDGARPAPINNTLLAPPAKQTERITGWEEEIFADIISCLIGGPLTALSIQDLMRGETGARFFDDHGTHPLPAIRPLLYTYILDKYLKMQNAAPALERRWKDQVLRPRTAEKDLEYEIEFRCEKRTLGDLFARATQMVDETIDAISQDVRERNQGSDLLDTGKSQFRWSDDTADIDKLYEAFFSNLSGDPPPLYSPFQGAGDEGADPEYGIPDAREADHTTKRKRWKARIEAILKGTPTWWSANGDEIVTPPPLADGEPHEINPVEWLAVLEAGGWTDGGTQGGKAH